jgi:subtilisin family serine protease
MLSLLFSAIVAPGNLEPIVVEGVLCHPQRLLIKSSDVNALRSIEKQGRIIKRFPEIGWSVIEAPIGRLQQARRQLSSVAGIEAVELDRAARPAYEPNDPQWPNMWHFRTIKAHLAWDISFGSSQAVVAVIDTGVQVNHPDLQQNIWVNDGEIPGNNIDDDANGYVDDINGYDFAYDDPDPNDVFGHGTPCSGIVGAVQDNSVGVTGVAPRARIMCLKSAIDSGYLYDSANVPAYLYAANNGAKVMSMSFYSDRVSQAERDAIDYCSSQGVLPVAASANEASVYPFYPAAYENTLAVAAVNGDLTKAGFSDFGTWVDVAAPGVGLTTTAVGGGYTNGFGGTSGACPHVAGLAALMVGANPSATASQIRAAIEDTAVPLSQAPFGEFCNYGLINCEAALQTILTTPAPARSHVVRYVTPLGLEASTILRPVKTAVRVYGRGFQPPASASATYGGINAPVLGRSRDYMDIALLTKKGDLRIDVGGVITTIPRPPIKGLMYSMIEASAPGASVTGGFFETVIDDGVTLNATRRGDGFIYVQATFRRVRRNPTYAALKVTRRYTGTSAGTEKIYLYDWSSASYPYGTFVELSSMAVMGTPTTNTIAVPNLNRFIDPEGTVYLLFRTSDDLDAGAKLEVDSLYLVQNP